MDRGHSASELHVYLGIIWDDGIAQPYELSTGRHFTESDACHIIYVIIMHQSSVDSFSREIDEIWLSPLHQRARETMHY